MQQMEHLNRIHLPIQTTVFKIPQLTQQFQILQLIPQFKMHHSANLKTKAHKDNKLQINSHK